MNTFEVFPAVSESECRLPRPCWRVPHFKPGKALREAVDARGEAPVADITPATEAEALTQKA